MDASDLQSLVIFALRGKRYAIGSAFVKEVLPMIESTSIPTWPDDAIGLIEVRGELIPLVDIAPALGGRPVEISVNQFILTLTVDRTWCVVVDKVDGVSQLGVQAYAELAPYEFAGAANMCEGVAVDSDGPIVVLNPHEFLRRFSLIELQPQSVPSR